MSGYVASMGTGAMRWLALRGAALCRPISSMPLHVFCMVKFLVWLPDFAFGFCTQILDLTFSLWFPLDFWTWVYNQLFILRLSSLVGLTQTLALFNKSLWINFLNNYVSSTVTDTEDKQQTGKIGNVSKNLGKTS